ncbi:hypothetical protein GMES_0677 [Paraglaciecola mesophila KMM 241]|uniref:Uncharacterized protein n=1 Tax=Paraglaciecola mesophila KMM 241 TaxID=1128912 RepID=K6YXT8_9ALTE|nr:hypothetical protein GMES_0677 [Paraglaciecola mesophila KMM 241]
MPIKHLKLEPFNAILTVIISFSELNQAIAFLINEVVID